jgi:hypothetical protein
MTQSDQTTTTNAAGVEELLTVALSQLGVQVNLLNGPLTPISTPATNTRDFVLKLSRGFGGWVLTAGSAIAQSGAVVVAFPGTKVRANSGSVVIAYRDVEVIAHKKATVLRVKAIVMERPAE